jgi:hypothetical protein
MTHFEERVAQAAIVADPGCTAEQQAENVLAKMLQIEAAQVGRTLTELVSRHVLAGENTMPSPDTEVPANWTSPFLPTFLKFTKGENWEK